MGEFFREERPQQDLTPGYGTGGGSGGGGSGGGGGGSGGGGGWSWGWYSPGEPEPEEGIPEPEEEIWHLLATLTYETPCLVTDATGQLLTHNGALLIAQTGCLPVVIYCQIDGDAGGAHTSCILLSCKTEEAAEQVLAMKLPGAHGTLRIFARWQEGHWPYSIAKVRFKIGKNGTPGAWMTLAISPAAAKEIFTLTI